ncbi:hypothetical protein EDEG_00801 [Edhazardia aedis USNM 41457]|uniref:Ribosomal protein eL8/eL30/eS12/Gadd45 domain-containing protein n=1 Tax=Edhazardia aedis (strain USNM 41457) TaxID=1003232 RepID=J8ZZN5_EDHAE|nr:hypothetical protein EDEG_00801 [Edhazardia aedis USNM 41457]|eukprot:EJW05088.1 hypothetical protein EDEG_00801 [Edhazardia aedis USNM 41457]
MADEIYAPIIDTQMTIEDALKQVCKISNGNKTIRKGFNQVTKAILRKQAQVVILANNYSDQMKGIIIGLCKKYEAPIIRVDTSEQLGSIVGFEKFKSNDVLKIGKCGCAAIIDFVYPSEGRYFIENALRDHST